MSPLHEAMPSVLFQHSWDATIAGMAATQTFTEYNDGEGVLPNWQRTFYGGIFSAGTNHNYSVVYSFSTGKIYMSVDGSTKATTPWTPEQEWHTGWHGQFFGETLDRGDDVSGTPAAKTNFTALGNILCRGCSYVNPPNPDDVQDLAVYKFVWVTQPTSFNIWTER
jgi:hypothetical protein